MKTADLLLALECDAVLTLQQIYNFACLKFDFLPVSVISPPSSAGPSTSVQRPRDFMPELMDSNCLLASRLSHSKTPFVLDISGIQVNFQLFYSANFNFSLFTLSPKCLQVNTSCFLLPRKQLKYKLFKYFCLTCGESPFPIVGLLGPPGLTKLSE